MKFFSLIIVILCLGLNSCTIEKTKFEEELIRDIDKDYVFEEALSLSNGNYTIQLESLNASFYKGYNEIRLKIVNRSNNEVVKNAHINILPILSDRHNIVSSCPYSHNIAYNNLDECYKAYAVFTEESNSMQNWDLYISFVDNGDSIHLVEPILVEAQRNKNLNMTSFVGNNGIKYIIALVAPIKPVVAYNELIAGIYKCSNTVHNSLIQYTGNLDCIYEEAMNYSLLLDPRMPEPSMGNHSSPNNEDLRQGERNLYYGVVNYTMTGNWTLNFILQNAIGDIIKGNEVSNDFTPGVVGSKSELHIDILF